MEILPNSPVSTSSFPDFYENKWQNPYYLVVEEFGDVREELEAEVQLYGLTQDTRRHATASVPAHLTGLCPQSHLDQDTEKGSVKHYWMVKSASVWTIEQVR